MYIEREADRFLVEWKSDPHHMPLIIKGARQVGKTETIRTFAKNNYKNIIEINFALESKYKTICSSGYTVDEIIKNISRIDPSKEFIPYKTLIFFDELQEYPEIATSLKAFREDGRYDVILSGSLLGINYNRIESNSVGNKTEYDMKSLNFKEFLLAKGYEEGISGYFLDKMLKGEALSDSEMASFSELYLDYAVLGGMPAVVKKYIETGTFSKTLDIQREILTDYREDIRKYAGGLDQARITRVFDSIPVQLSKENKKFQISKIAHGARFRDYGGCIEWLSDAGIINICYCMNFPELPLKGNYDESKYKVYMADTGLLVASLDDYASEDLRANKNLGVYKGALYENMMAENLSKLSQPVYYYKKEDSTLEEDFLLRSRNSLVPIEVKAGSNRSRSLRKLIDSDKYSDIHFGIKFADSNISHSDSIYTFPHFTEFIVKDFLEATEC